MNRATAIGIAILAGVLAVAIVVPRLPVPAPTQTTGESPAVFAESVVPASEAGNLFDDELVIGIVANGEAKAYPAGMLQATELIHDKCGGIPICVTW